MTTTPVIKDTEADIATVAIARLTAQEAEMFTGDIGWNGTDLLTVDQITALKNRTVLLLEFKQLGLFEGDPYAPLNEGAPNASVLGTLYVPIPVIKLDAPTASGQLIAGLSLIDGHATDSPYAYVSDSIYTDTTPHINVGTGVFRRRLPTDFFRPFKNLTFVGIQETYTLCYEVRWSEG